MTEKSYYWDGTVTGDASLAPYSTEIYNALLWYLLLSSSVNEGYISGFEDELEVIGVATAVSVGIGAAIVNGTFYRNSLPLSFAIDTPTTNPRIDTIVLRKSWASQKVRLALLAGAENASPTAPALAQLDLLVWEIPLANILITTAGVIVVTDRRENAVTSLVEGGSMQEIETITMLGTETEFDFQNIPSTYKSLILQGSIQGTLSAGATIYLNGDTTNANYNRQFFGVFLTSPFAQALLSRPERITTFVTGAYAQASTLVSMEIPNYAKTGIMRVLQQFEQTIPTVVANDATISSGNVVWTNTAPVDRITIVLDGSGGVFKAGSTLTLYGRL